MTSAVVGKTRRNFSPRSGAGQRGPDIFIWLSHSASTLTSTHLMSTSYLLPNPLHRAIFLTFACEDSTWNLACKTVWLVVFWYHRISYRVQKVYKVACASCISVCNLGFVCKPGFGWKIIRIQRQMLFAWMLVTALLLLEPNSKAPRKMAPVILVQFQTISTLSSKYTSNRTVLSQLYHLAALGWSSSVHLGGRRDLEWKDWRRRGGEEDWRRRRRIGRKKIGRDLEWTTAWEPPR